MSNYNKIKQVVSTLDTIVLGKHRQVKLALACLLADGHLLIEDLPGLGKTTLSHALANVLGLTYNRVQFTSDLLPSDITGVNIYSKNTESFRFQPGPIFSEVVLGDEINRASPKAQSALLEAMEERQVSIEGQTHSLPKPFFVIATQNPQDQAGTFPLPESQLDRFLMRIHLGYPPEDAEIELLKGVNRRGMVAGLSPLLSKEELLAIQNNVLQIKASDTIIHYIQRLANYTRNEKRFHYGLSPRGSIALLRAARAWALLSDRDYVLPEDVQAVMPSVLEHRLSSSSTTAGAPLTEHLITNIDIY